MVTCLASCEKTRYENIFFTCEFNTEVNGGGQNGRALLSVKNSIDGDELATPIQAVGRVWLYSDPAASKALAANSSLHIREQLDRFNMVMFRIEEMELVTKHSFHRGDEICLGQKYFVSRMDLAFGCKRDLLVGNLINVPRVKNYCVLEEVSAENFGKLQGAYEQQRKIWTTKWNDLQEEKELKEQRQLDDRKL